MPESNITKKALAGALKQLMNRSQLTKITVGDICGQCSMNRKSFYYHFRDKYELVNWIFYNEFVEIIQNEALSMEDGWNLIRRLCLYFYQNRLFYVNALETTGQDSFGEYFSEVLRPVVLTSIQDSLGKIDDADFFASFYVDAFLVSIKRWLMEDTMDADTYSSLLRRVVEN